VTPNEQMRVAVRAVELDESAIRRAFDAGLMDLAATAAFRAHHDQILRFLTTRLRDPGDAREVFSMFAEDLWRGLPAFDWRCSMRTWSYCLARNAASRYLGSRTRQRAHLQVSHLDELADVPSSSSTVPYMKDAVKDRFRALREQLSDADQKLLVLRVEHAMSWSDIVHTMRGDTNLDDDTLARETARLRKAFQRVKADLRKRAEREGLI